MNVSHARQYQTLSTRGTWKLFWLYKLVTENLHLATIFLQLVAKKRPKDFFNFEPWQGDPFLEHLLVVEKDNKNTSKPVARPFNLPNHSKQHMAVCSLSYHRKLQNSWTKSCSRYQQTLFIRLIYPPLFHIAMHQPIAQLHLSVYKPQTNHTSLIRSEEG